MDVKWSGDYVEIISPEDYPYEAVHPSDSVIAVPVVGGEYVIRKEVCPPYMVKEDSNKEKFWTVVSGAVDEGERPLETLKREVEEETGISLNRIRVIQREEQTPYHKLSTQRVSFYFFEVLDHDEVEATGDGTITEELSETHRVTYDRLIDLSKRDDSDLLLYFCAQCAKSYESDT